MSTRNLIEAEVKKKEILSITLQFRRSGLVPGNNSTSQRARQLKSLDKLQRAIAEVGVAVVIQNPQS